MSNFIIKKQNRKVTKKAVKQGFPTWEQARQAARKLIRAEGKDSDWGLTTHGYSIAKTTA